MFSLHKRLTRYNKKITNQILEDCVAVCNPRGMKVIANFNTRGGTEINVEAVYERD